MEVHGRHRVRIAASLGRRARPAPLAHLVAAARPRAGRRRGRGLGALRRPAPGALRGAERSERSAERPPARPRGRDRPRPRAVDPGGRIAGGGRCRHPRRLRPRRVLHEHRLGHLRLGHHTGGRLLLPRGARRPRRGGRADRGLLARRSPGRRGAGERRPLARPDRRRHPGARRIRLPRRRGVPGRAGRLLGERPAARSGRRGGIPRAGPLLLLPGARRGSAAGRSGRSRRVGDRARSAPRRRAALLRADGARGAGRAPLGRERRRDRDRAGGRASGRHSVRRHRAPDRARRCRGRSREHSRRSARRRPAARGRAGGGGLRGHPPPRRVASGRAGTAPRAGGRPGSSAWAPSPSTLSRWRS